MGLNEYSESRNCKVSEFNDKIAASTVASLNPDAEMFAAIIELLFHVFELIETPFCLVKQSAILLAQFYDDS